MLSLKQNEVGYQLVLITNRKSHAGFQLVPTSVTLNDLEWHNSAYFVIPPNSIALQAEYIRVVENGPILSPEYRLSLLAKTDPPCSAVSL